MGNDELRAELERIYGTVRQAFADYELDAARPYLDLPPDAPVPTREESEMMAQFLPDLATAAFMELRTEGTVAGYYTETGSGECEVTVIRFLSGESGWKLAPAPHSMSSYSTDDFGPGEGAKLVEREESLALVPDGLV
ncbi:MAG: hypothetical protein ABFS86_05525 [Planctomycetota bacterium]